MFRSIQIGVDVAGLFCLLGHQAQCLNKERSPTLNQLEHNTPHFSKATPISEGGLGDVRVIERSVHLRGWAKG